MDYDIKIVGGTIVDGTGAERYRGDLGVKDGRIVALGDAPGAAAETVDADGRVVAPGFVDPHTHYDAQVVWDRMLSISPWHGVTTVVMGNCGFGVAPTRPGDRDYMMRTLQTVEDMSFDAMQEGLGRDWPFESFGEYLDAVEGAGTAINVASLIGHTPVRLFVMGEGANDRAARPEEIVQMREIVRAGLKAGALGFATSGSRNHIDGDGKPVPSRFAEFEETKALARVLGEEGTGLFQATMGPSLFHDEFAEIAAETGRPVTWTALLSGMSGPGSHQAHLDRTREMRAQGLQVVPQVACRPIMVEFHFDSPAPFIGLSLFKPLFETDKAGRIAAYRDPEFRRHFKESYAPTSKKVLREWWNRAWIADSPSDPSLNETRLDEAAAARGVDPTDLALDLALADDLKTRFRVGVMNADEDEVAELLRADETVLALSDAGAHTGQLCDACYSTHLLGHWVREKGTLELERAIHMLTGRPAALFGVADRGLLAAGRPADLVMFDPATVGAGGLRRVRDMPAGAERLVSDAFGIDLVMVNGTVIRRDGADAVDPTGALPGRVLRHGRAAA